MKKQLMFFAVAGLLVTFAEAFGIDWWSVPLLQVSVSTAGAILAAVLATTWWARRKRVVHHLRLNRFTREMFLSASHIAAGLASVLFGCAVGSSLVGWVEGSTTGQVFAVIGWTGVVAMIIASLIFRNELHRIRV